MDGFSFCDSIRMVARVLFLQHHANNFGHTIATIFLPVRMQRRGHNDEDNEDPREKKTLGVLSTSLQTPGLSRKIRA